MALLLYTHLNLTPSNMVNKSKIIKKIHQQHRCYKNFHLLVLNLLMWLVNWSEFIEIQQNPESVLVSVMEM